MSAYPLPEGLYDAVLTPELRDRIAATAAPAHIADIPDAQLPGVLGRHVGAAVRRHLASLSAADRLAAASVILGAVAETRPDIPDGATLTAIGAAGALPRPSTPLSEGALLTNSRDEPSLAAELALEMRSADDVDLLCAFVRFAGVRVLGEQFEALRDRGISPRVITTTYIGATERRALDVLVRDYGATVKVHYETKSTRLHAKAWLFRRHSGYDTAYIGSSNLSRSALVDGLEWNVRLSSVAHASEIAKFRGVFDSYWLDHTLETYDPDRDGDLLDRQLAESGGQKSSSVLISLSGLEVRPYPHQRLMLDALEVERTVFDRHRNLLVAATGTGKTVVAALDFQRLCDNAATPAERPTLLVVAHRREILRQALRTYREVLGDPNFGELFVGGDRPRQWTHVFASIQSLTTSGADRTDWDVVVVDEFHHAEAGSYRRLLRDHTAAELLGLTATPERHDGVDVREFFDGRSAYELRLWDALEQDLLCPFHYYGIADNTDLNAIAWTPRGYDLDQLGNLYTGHDARTRLILAAVRDHIADPARMRALGFCATVEHAEYMARAFTRAGLPSEVIVGTTPTAQRDDRRAALVRGELACVFTVDVFNEGVDIPQVDTVLFLRPTQSATVYLQQLGRGLRRTAGKAQLVALDFVGHHRADFDLSARFHAMTGASRTRLVDEVERGFPFLPGASRIVLDRVTRDEVLRSIAQQLSRNRIGRLAADLTQVGIETRLAEYLRETGRTLDDVYAAQDRTWTAIRIRAGGSAAPAPAGEERELLRRMRLLRTIDDPDRLREYLRVTDLIAAGQTPGTDDRWAVMLLDLLFFARKLDDYGDAAAQLARYPRVTGEMSELLEAAADGIRHLPAPLEGRLAELPLRSHASYHRAELLAALGWSSPTKRPAHHREGVAWCEQTRTDLLLVTLHKDERSFSPSTMYRDVPVTAELFDWESQSTTRRESPTGQRYVGGQGGNEVVIAVRNYDSDAVTTAPYLVLGTADIVSADGDRPIRIRWKLRRPMPPDVLAQASMLPA